MSSVEKLNAALSSDAAVAEFLRDSLREDPAIPYIWTTIYGHLMNYVNAHRKRAGEIPFSNVGPDSTEDDVTPFEERIADKGVSPEELALKKDEYERLLHETRDVILANSDKSQGQRDWFVFQSWLTGKQLDQIAEETTWLKNENSVDAALERIVFMLRDNLQGERSASIKLKEKTRKGSKGRTIDQNEGFKRWYDNLNEERKAALREKNRLAIAERRRKAKEAPKQRAEE